MKNYFALLLFITSLAFTGCKPEMQFYWGEYSKTYYAYKKTPSDKTLGEHKKSLIDIITVSTSKRSKTPPGVYAELGYILLNEGKNQDGLSYFNKEIQLYPESREFIEKLKTESKSGDNQ